MSTGTGAGAALGPAAAADRGAIEAILRRTGLFNEKEIEVALEVLDVYLFREGQEDYRVYTAGFEGRIAGYVCFGPNSMTEGVFELYWIAVDPDVQRRGAGASLMDLAEREAILAGGRKMAVETSSRTDYEGTLSFYRRLGYREEARVADFYSVGDDKVIFIKDLPPDLNRDANEQKSRVHHALSVVHSSAMKIGLTYNLREGDEPGADLPVDADEEFDSPETIDAIARVLGGAGHEVRKLGFGREFLDSLLSDPPEFVFNIAEGLAGRNRESQVPALLEMLAIPYSGSDPLTLGLTLDKDLAKRVVASRGLATPGHIMVDDPRSLERDGTGDLSFPLMVKPALEGSSKGIRLASRVGDAVALRKQVEWLFGEYGGPVMVEEFLDGEEFTVGVIGNAPPRVLGVMMIRHRTLPTEDFLYSLEVKRDWENQVEYLVPPPVPEQLLSDIGDLALGVYTALGCRDVARVDIRLREGTPHFLEVNPLPGLSPEYGDLVIMARKEGWSYEALVLEILREALTRADGGGP